MVANIQLADKFNPIKISTAAALKFAGQSLSWVVFAKLPFA